MLTDVDRLASWVGIVHDVVELSRLEKYSAVLLDRVGPFKLRADLEINVNVVRDGEEVELDASGRDRAVDSRIAVRAQLRLDAAEHGGSTILTQGRYRGNRPGGIDGLGCHPEEGRSHPGGLLLQRRGSSSARPMSIGEPSRTARGPT